MEKIKKCNVCESSDFDNFISTKDFSVSKELFSLSQCLSCGFVFTNPKPKDEDLYKYYISKNYISHTNSKKTLFEKTYQIIRKYTLHKKYLMIKKIISRGKILDIGSGTGDFLYKFKKNNWETRGVEPNKKARESSIKKYNLNVDDSFIPENIKEKFDIISMWHVLEHIPDINKTIENINKSLKKDGKLIVAVPNLESWDAKYYKKHWAAYDVPIHLHHFSKKTISQLLDNHGFKMASCSGMKFDSFYVSMLSEEYKTGKKNFIRACVIGAISNIAGYISKRGFSSQTYIFEKKT